MRSARISSGLFLGLLLLRLPLMGQDATATNTAASAAAIAEQQGEDEKTKRLAADVESLRAANQALTEKLAALTEENRQIRADLARLAGDESVPDQVKLLGQKIEILARKIEEVDKKREEDKEAISGEITKSSARLEKLLGEATAPAPRNPNKPAANAGPAEAEMGVKYTIKEGDLLVDILRACNDKFKSEGKKTISQKQIMDANPKVVWNRLQIGQQIIIPLPPE